MTQMFLKKVCLTLALALSLAGCVSMQNVRGKPVPTAFFVFFEAGQSEPTAESKAVFDEAAAYLKQYDNTSVRIVGHVSPDETAPQLDQQRASRVAEELVKRGALAARMDLLGVGSQESLSGGAKGGDPAMDRRVEVLFNTM